MLQLKLENGFFLKTIDNIGNSSQRFSKEKKRIDCLEKLCEKVSDQSFSLHFSGDFPTKKELEDDLFTDILIGNCKSSSRFTDLLPLNLYFTQLGLVFKKETRNEWIEKGYECISVETVNDDIDRYNYEFDYDLTKGMSFSTVKDAINSIKINFNTVIIVDAYIGNKKMNRELLDEFLKVMFANNNCKSEIEIIVLTIIKEGDILSIYKELNVHFSKFLNIKYKLFALPDNKLIHDRRIFTNDRQMYSGIGFSGSGSEGFFKTEYDRVKGSFSTLTKDPKIQFKNQIISDNGISSLELGLKNIKEIIVKSENRPASIYLKEHLRYYPDKNLNFIQMNF
jgi:hypothetical protein